MPHIVIIGNGIAGITCARHLRKRSDASITVISGESDYFFSRTALMYVYMGHMKYEHIKPYEDWFWEKNRIDLKKGWVNNVDFDRKEVAFESGENLRYDKLVLATGSKPRLGDWLGAEADGVQGLYSLQDLQLLEKNTHPPLSKHKRVKHAVVVGGGLIGVEMAEMLRTRGIEVTMLVRESRYWGGVLGEEEAELVEGQFSNHGVELRFETELKEVLAGKDGRVEAVLTSNGETIGCEFVGVAVGVEPNVAFLKGARLHIDKGIVVDDYLETNIPNVYAIGDCAQLSNPPGDLITVNQVWYTGRIMGETLAVTLSGSRTKLSVGPWFNSAKFFDLEYQTYGVVLPDETSSRKNFVWQNDNPSTLIKVQFDVRTFKIQGINALGVRLSHEVFDRWLSEEASMQQVLKDFKKAIFDPEFSKSIVPDIIAKWNASFPDHKVKVRSKFKMF